ncbi:MAG: AAA family ATPase [Shimia sp.]
MSFSVENYRSITTARKIPLSDYSLLVGANNEGKSNILHALTLGMDALIE